jgi:hypothetical protein
MHGGAGVRVDRGPERRRHGRAGLAGVYAWRARYSGDANNLSLTGACDPASVAGHGDKKGAFSFTAGAPEKLDPFVLYRVSVRDGRKTYSTQVAVAANAS